jgi:hypothetical protein
MNSKTEALIDRIVAMCDGDLRGALKALMLVNEHLELQLEQFPAASMCTEKCARRTGSLH